MSEEKIEVSLGKWGGKKVFNSRDEVRQWLKEEQMFWQWLQMQPMPYSKQIIYQQYANFFNNVGGLLQQAGINGFQSVFSQHFDNQAGIYSGSPFAKFVAEVREKEGDSIAAAIMGYAMRRSFNFQEYDSFRGAQLGFAFESGLRERIPSEATALEKLRLDWEQIFQKLKETLQGEAGTYNGLNAGAKKWLDDEGIRFKGASDKQAGEINQLIADTKKQWQDLKKTYDESLALRSPVTYWTKKARSHFWLSWAFAAVSALAAGASLYFLIPTVKSMMAVPQGIQDAEKWHPEYWRLAILIASALFCVWVIRILVRLFLSHVHLLTDANERVVMVQTYLALLKRGKLKDDQALYILQTLFRPSQTGLVKDDAVPLTFVEAITKLKP